MLLVSSFVKLAEVNPSDKFIFISNQPFPADFPALKNIETIVLPQQSQNPLLWKLWYNYKLPAILKKHKVNLVVHAGIACSLRTKLSQYILVNDLSFLQQPAWLDKKYGRFVRSNAPAFLNKAKKVFTTSQAIKNSIVEKYTIDIQKTELLYPFPGSGYQPLQWKEKETAKEQYAEGKEFFLFAGPLNESSNLISLLKAFSFFKKRQKSNMQLLVVYPGPDEDKNFKESLRLYKFRQEVKLLAGLNETEMQKVTAAAYVFVYPVLRETSAGVLLNALQCEVPVITNAGAAANEILGDAVLYCNPNNFEDIAQKMMLLFKDENSRNELIAKGKQQAGKYSLDKTSAVLWQSVTKDAG